MPLGNLGLPRKQIERNLWLKSYFYLNVRAKMVLLEEKRVQIGKNCTDWLGEITYPYRICRINCIYNAESINFEITFNDNDDNV